MQKKEWATIGTIVAPFGIRGELKVLPLSDIPDRFVQLDAVYLAPAYACYKIEGVRPYKGEMLVLKLSTIDDANAAELLRNHDLCIPLDQIAQLPPDSYYQHDILGLRVCTLDGNEVGVIVDIMPTGGNDVYVIQKADRSEVLIPAIKQTIKQIDLIRRMMYIDPIRGLLDDEAILDSSHASEGDEEV
ncbi:MAG: 16S rRNA processing protein RimM [Chloroflexi bacterium]|nr:MAG: 16S rRNA processing protein RimM [Chloroflexota bacterium]